jgi:hypothetical protein
MAIVDDGQQYFLITHTQRRMAIAEDGQQYFLATKMA